MDVPVWITISENVVIESICHIDQNRYRNTVRNF